MKETEQRKETKIEVVSQVEQQKQNVLIGRNILKKGHVLWEYNRDTFEIIPAVSERLPYKHTGVVKTNNLAYFAKHTMQSGSNVNVKKNCIYISALNKKNVLKVLKRDFGIDC